MNSMPYTWLQFNITKYIYVHQTMVRSISLVEKVWLLPKAIGESHL